MDGMLFNAYFSTAEIEAGIEYVLASPRDVGTLEMIVRRPKINAREVIERGELDVANGLVGDNWLKKGSRWRRGGDPERQLTVMNWRFAKLIAGAEGRIPLAGDQLYVDLDLSIENLPPGARIAIGERAIIEVTKPPHLGCKKFVERFGIDAMMYANSDFGRIHNLRGVNAKVIEFGSIKTLDRVRRVPKKPI